MVRQMLSPARRAVLECSVTITARIAYVNSAFEESTAPCPEALPLA